MKSSSRFPDQIYSWNPPPLPGSVKDVGSAIKFFQYLFIVVSVATLVTFVVWIADRRETTVVSSQPIGRFMSMSGPGGFPRSVVMETEVGSYPLLGDLPVIIKGTALVLEERASGERYICDLPHNLCVHTAGKEFKPATQSAN